MPVTVRRYKRKNGTRDGWEVDIRGTTPEGKPFRRRLKAPMTGKENAKRWGQRKLQDWLDNGLPWERPPEPEEIPTVAEFASEFLDACAAPTATRRGANGAGELANKADSLKVIVPALGKLRVDVVKVKDIERFAAKSLSDKSISHSANVLQTLRRMLRMAGERYEFTPPKVNVPQKPSRNEYFRQEDIEDLVAAHHKPERRVLVLVAVRTGLRVGELRALRWSDVDLQKPCVYVRRSVTKAGVIKKPKSGKPRRVPLAWDAAEALANMERRGELVFAEPDGSMIGHWAPLRTVQLAAKRAEVWPVDDEGDTIYNPPRAHTCRHTFASHAAMAGVAIATLQKWLGHADIRTTMRYAHLAPTHADEQIDLLAPPRDLRVIEGEKPGASGDIVEAGKRRKAKHTKNAPHGKVRGVQGAPATGLESGKRRRR